MMMTKPNPVEKPYSFMIALYKTAKNVAVVLVPFIAVVEGMKLPGEYGPGVSLVASGERLCRRLGGILLSSR